MEETGESRTLQGTAGGALESIEQRLAASRTSRQSGLVADLERIGKIRKALEPSTFMFIAASSLGKSVSAWWCDRCRGTGSLGAHDARPDARH